MQERDRRELQLNSLGETIGIPTIRNALEPFGGTTAPSTCALPALTLVVIACTSGGNRARKFAGQHQAQSSH